MEDDFFKSNNAKTISEEEFEEIANGYEKEEIVFVKDENSVVWRYSEDDEGDTRLYRDLMTEFISDAPDDILLHIMGIDR